MASLGDTVAALAGLRFATSINDPAGAGLTEIAAFGDNPGALRMLVHAPAGLRGKAPLVVVLHGCTQTAPAYARGAGWIELADRCGFVLLCPEQTRSNNPNLCFNWFQPSDISRGGGEAASIHAMIQRAVADYDLDAGQVFVTGLSAGGAMATTMLATYPEVFAGGAIIAGLPYGVASNMQEAFSAMHHGRALPTSTLGDAVRSASSHSGPWPRISVWQGDEDSTVNAGVADDLVRQWRNVHGVETATAEQSATGRHRQAAWRNDRGDVVVELHQLSGMGHGAPLGCTLEQGCGTAGPYLLEVGVSSTLEIAQAWGLVEAGAVRNVAASPPPPTGGWERPAATSTATAPPLPPGRAVASDIGSVITDALRSAGLLK